MLKASALYIVIVIALVIALLCSSLIVAAYYYKVEYQRKFRYDRLTNNISSAINILLANTDSSYSQGKTMDVFGDNTDSISLQRLPWGIFDIGVAKAFIQKDTLLKVFSLANTIDSGKWAALYLTDEQRPFSLSGKTTIRGDAYIPAAGVKEAYVDNTAYQGDKRLIIGIKHFSGKKLPPPDENRLNHLKQYLDQGKLYDGTLPRLDSIQRSFTLSTQFVNFKKEIHTLSNISLTGNIALVSDTSLIIDSTARLKNVLIFARSITIKSGFHGNAQFFATDSIKVDSSCRFTYPSCLAVLRFYSPQVSSQEKITLGNNTVFEGTIFTYEKTETPVKPLIVIGKRAKITGQIYSQGILELNDKSEVDGSVFTSRFLYRSAFTLYENYLINITIDSKALSPYYLSSELLPVTNKKKKVLQWLEGN